MINVTLKKQLSIPNLTDMFRSLIHPYTIANNLEHGSRSHVIEVVRLDFPVSFLKNIHCYQVQGLTRNHKMAYGLGTDLNINLSMIKAYVEFVERSAFHEIGHLYGFNSTNGIAGHRFKTLAAKSAISEIHERDSFLLHWYLKIPMVLISPPGNLDAIITDLKESGFKALFYETFLGELTTISCFIVNESTGGFIVGLSAGKSKIIDCQKALTEALVNLYFGDYGRGPETLKDLKANGFTKLDSHRAYWYQIATFPAWMLESANPADYFGHIAKVNAPREVFHNKFGNVSVVGIRAIDNLSIIVGPPKEKDLDNLRKRTSKALAERIAEASLQPHPIP